MSNKGEKSDNNELLLGKHSALSVQNRRSCVLRCGDNNNQKTSHVMNIPEAKCIQIYINGDEYFSGCRCVVNSRYYRNLDMFLNYLTERLQPSFGAFRHLYTPTNGHPVHSLEDLVTRQKYVAAGNERFKKLDLGYLEASEKKNKRARLNPKNKFKATKMKTHSYNPLTLYLYQNGNYKMKPCKLSIPTHDLENLDFVYKRISDNLKWGPIKRLCLLNGKPVRTIEELENNQFYVTVAKHEIFKVGQYGYNLQKNSFPKEKRNFRHSSHKASALTTRSSEVHSLSSAQSLRLANSVSSCRSNIKPSISISQVKNEPKKNILEDSEFSKSYQYFNSYENMLKSNSAKNDFITKNNLDLDADLGGIFRSKLKNSQTTGAVEIEDSPETAIDLPVDLLDAEEIEDEITPDMERSFQHLNLDVEEIVAFLPSVPKKNNERQLSGTKHNLSHSQTLDSHDIYV